MPSSSNKNMEAAVAVLGVAIATVILIGEERRRKYLPFLYGGSSSSTSKSGKSVNIQSDGPGGSQNAGPSDETYVPDNANSGCVGVQSEQAGKATGCAGCPNQGACASGEAAKVDPVITLV